MKTEFDNTENEALSIARVSDSAGIQSSLFEDLDDKYQSEWKDMPEFNMNPEIPIFTLKLSFKTQKDIEDFGKLINQKVAKNKENYWFPKLNRNAFSELKYVDDES